jgi:hypothetical protein
MRSSHLRSLSCVDALANERSGRWIDGGVFTPPDFEPLPILSSRA